MEYQIRKNGQVMKVEYLGDAIIEAQYCRLEEQSKTRIENQYKIETLVFNPETETQEVTNTTFEPVPKEILLDELKSEYLPQIKDADMLGDDVEKARLQQEYLQKKAEIES